MCGFSKITSIIVFLTFIKVHPLIANDMSLALLKKSQEFYLKFNSYEVDKIRTLENDDLSQLNPDDLIFLKNRIKIYGLAPLKTESTQMTIFPDNKEKEIVVDYISLDQSSISIRGLNYSFYIYRGLKGIYEVDYKKSLKKFKKETSFFKPLVLAPFALSGCVEASTKDSEASYNSASLPVAYLMLCADCASIAANPGGALVGVGGAAIKGISAGIKNKSLKTCGIEFCKNLPGIRSFLEVSAAHKNAAQNKIEHNSSK